MHTCHYMNPLFGLQVARMVHVAHFQLFFFFFYSFFLFLFFFFCACEVFVGWSEYSSWVLTGKRTWQKHTRIWKLGQSSSMYKYIPRISSNQGYPFQSCPIVRLLISLGFRDPKIKSLAFQYHRWPSLMWYRFLSPLKSGVSALFYRWSWCEVVYTPHAMMSLDPCKIRPRCDAKGSPCINTMTGIHHGFVSLLIK